MKSLLQIIRFCAVLLACILFCGLDSRPSATDGFATGMDAAVARMHSAMHISPSGDPDRDFARMMIPHHQGAIDMALVELRYGKDERLRRLAQGIIVEQQQEIAVMHLALGDPPSSGAPRSTLVPRSKEH